MIDVIASIYVFIRYLIVVVILFTIVLMLLRHILTSFNVNPFTWYAMWTWKLSDPIINRVKHGMRNVGVPPKYAPLIAILLVVLLGWFALQLAEGVLKTAAGVLISAADGRVGAVIGHLLYGMLALYGLMIFIRIIFSWGKLSYGNRAMRFLINATDPVLVPLRKMIPPVGMFDLSPIVAFIIVWVLQAAVQATLIR